MLLECTHIKLVVAVSLQKTSGQLKSEKEIGTTRPCFLSHNFFYISMNSFIICAKGNYNRFIDLRKLIFIAF